ncbi:unnamed protein product [Urochloa decumbens]|uniref:Uncharacterized protein n=1 Tax=Urochloa decumbens TaxID=240449 RepID=A0ABC8W9D5_9POAL
MAATTSIAVSVSMGVLRPILGKLTVLLVDKCKKLKGVRKQLSFLQEELSTMYAFLEKLEPMDELDPLANNWRSHVREMAYDIEDAIDDFTCQLGSEDGPKEGFLKKTSRRLKALRARHPIASQISELRARVLEANERHRRYEHDNFIPTSDQGMRSRLHDCTTSTSTSVDPRLSALYNEATSLVGIENPKEELISMLMDERREKLRVVSIVGLGGLGKTTLARKVYDEVGEQFNCKVFLSVSQTPDISRLLHALLSQLGLPPPSCARELTDLIDYLREYLLTKRYLIVVDDLWDVSAWNIIRCVFPENGKPSRVIVTTRQRDVAVSCSSDDQGVHSMRPLNDQDSRKLFNNRIFGPDSEDACPPQFTDVSCEILKKCRGLPLAIITVASILACQRTRLKEEWEHIKDCLAAQEPTNTTLNDMMHILGLSYKFLPHRLQACFLYLGTYPEDFDIRKDDLVGKWVAEGFVSGSVSRDAWHVAEGYLNELVNRSMIVQRVSRTYGYNGPETATYYKVHDMMLEMILKKCRENNFARLTHYQQETMVDLQVKVRRLAVHISDANLKDDTELDVIIGRHLSQVRSLSLFGASCVPPLSELRFLRMLSLLLGFPRHENRVDLTCVSQLSLLRYLKVTCRGSPDIEVVLPSRIRSMQRLETLEIHGHRIGSIPTDIVELPCLSHLKIISVDTFKMLPDGICKVKSLRILREFRLPADSSHHIIEGLGELTNLAELSLYCHADEQLLGPCIPMTATWMAAWSSSLNKLSNLRMLRVESFPFSCCADALSSWVSPPFPFLEQLHVQGWTFSTVPRWIGGLHNLQSLEFGVKEVSNFRICGMLPNLIELDLRIEGDVPAEGIVISGSTGFKLLELFDLRTRSTSEVAFEAGAMPNLRQLGLIFDQKESDKATVPVGLEHLGRLRIIRIIGVLVGAFTDTRDRFDAFIGMFRKAVKGLPSQPKFYSSYDYQTFSYQE